MRTLGRAGKGGASGAGSGSYTPRHPPLRATDRAGFTLVEILVVLAAVAVLATVSLAAWAPDPAVAPGGAARDLAASVAAALEQADAGEMEAILAVGGSGPDGRFLAIARGAGFDPAAVPAAEWTPLGPDVRWGAGVAAAGPAGDSVVAGGRMPAVARCAGADGCVVPEPPGAATYFLRHAREPAVVFAVTLSADGTVQTHRYLPETATWTPTAQ